MDNTKTMLKIYNEFGINIHEIPNSLQSSINSLIKEIIKLRKNKKCPDSLKKEFEVLKERFIEAWELLLEYGLAEPGVTKETWQKLKNTYDSWAAKEKTITCTFNPSLKYCTECGNNVLSVDGCPNCRTNIYLVDCHQ